ncbi:MAG: hypothetical protein ACR2K0_00310 [Acidimicrobiales bacterium]
MSAATRYASFVVGDVVIHDLIVVPLALVVAVAAGAGARSRHRR